MEIMVNEHKNKIPSDNRLYCFHVLILLSGVLIGVAIAYFINSMHFDFSHEIQEARELGIVSKTTIAGYPKSKDIFLYATVVIFTVGCSIGLWLLYARKDRRQKLIEIFYPPGTAADEKGISPVFLFLVVTCLIYLGYFAGVFYAPGYIDGIGEWPFIGEEGAGLAWAQSILSGGVYGKDFCCLYGPMMVYPVTWAMKFFGTTALTQRVCGFLMNLAAYGIVIAFLYRILKHKTVFLISCLIFIIAFSPFKTYSPHTSYLRVSLGMLPILLAFIYLENRKKYLLPIIGIIAGQSLLLSQEVGVCSVLSLAFLFSLHYLTEREWKALIRDGFIILAGLLCSIAPMLVYFAFKDALGSFINTLYYYPRFVMLGFGSLPFPSLNDFLTNPLGSDALFNYWVLFANILASVYLIPLIILKKSDRKTLLMAALLIFGLILFRAALGRSSQERALYVSQPAFLLIFFFADSALGALRGKLLISKKIGSLVLLAGIVSTIFLLFTNVHLLESNLNSAKYVLSNLDKKWTVMETGYRVPIKRTGGIFFHRRTVKNMMRIDRFLKAYTGPDDYVFFFPNEAAYYFLFDKNSPTRYVNSYFAVTYDQQRELISDLKEKDVKYIIYFKNTWRVDNIPERIQIPLVVEHINTGYKLFKDLGDVQIYVREDTARS
jgi:hypothetical protein